MRISDWSSDVCSSDLRLRRRHRRQHCPDHRRDRHRPGHRARRHPWRRPVLRGRHGRPEEGGLLLMATQSIEQPSPEALNPNMDLLRFATAGSVDDGKSTLIGRLLLDSKAIFEDQLEAVEATSQSKGYDYTDLALLTDGLRSEREQDRKSTRLNSSH